MLVGETHNTPNTHNFYKTFLIDPEVLLEVMSIGGIVCFSNEYWDERWQVLASIAGPKVNFQMPKVGF